MISFRNGMTSSRHIDKRICKDFVLTLFDFGSAISRNAGRKELKRSFKLLKFTMSLLGILPVTMNKSTQDYEFHWQRFATFHCLTTIVWLTVLVICSCVGLMDFIPISGTNSSTSPYIQEDPQFQNSSSTSTKGFKIQAEEFMGILVVLGSVYNAWVQTLTIFYRKRSLATFLNSWVHNILKRDIDPLPGLFKIASVSCIFLFVLAFLLLVVCLVGEPELLVGIVEAFSMQILMVPQTLMMKSTLMRKTIRSLTSVAVIHVFMIHKVTIMAFATNCKLLANSFGCWRKQLEVTLEEYWNPSPAMLRTPKTLQQLAESHWHIVSMLRQVESIFSPVLQFYYASSIVTLCTMLYFVAFQLGPSTYSLTPEEYIWQGMIILQFLLVFLVVSLSASKVHDQYEEVVRCVTLSPLAISANRFFVITKPFILTIIGVVISYFIIILQLHHS